MKRYCFRHSDGNWYATLWALLLLFVGVTLWVIVAGLLSQGPRQVQVAQAPMTTPAAVDQGPRGEPGTVLAAGQQGLTPVPERPEV